MAAGLPALPVGADPLIAEAKERARRRRLLALGAVVVVGVAATATLATRSPANAHGVCATPPSGWKVRTIARYPHMPPGAVIPPNVGLTNFRFGSANYLDGFGDGRLHWPPRAVTVEVRNVGQASAGLRDGPVRVVRSEFGPFEGVRNNFAQVDMNSHGRELVVWVRVGSISPATIAAANEALAGVRVCST